MSNEYTDAVTNFLREMDPARQARESYALGMTAQPDLEADLRKVSAITGIPVDSARAFPNEAKQQAQLAKMDFDAMADRFPGTTKFLTNVDNAKIAHDDVENMQSFEQTVLDGLLGLSRAIDQGGKRIIKGAVYDTPAGFFGMAGGVVENVQSGIELLGGKGKRQLAEPLFALRDMAKGGAKSLNIGDPESVGGAGIASGLESLGSNLATLPVGVLMRSATLATGLMSFISGGSSYNEAREKGASPLRALGLAVPDAGAEFLTEMPGVKQLFELPGLKDGLGALFRGIANFGVKEMLGEQVATVWQDFNKWMVLNPEKTVDQFLAERPDAAIQTAIATIVGGGGQIALMSGITAVVGQIQQAEKAPQLADTLAKLNKIAEASKVLQRDPATAEVFFQSVFEQSGVTDVWISPQALEASGVAQALVQTIPSVQDQIQSALASNHDIKISISELMSKFAGPNLEALIPHVATEPGGFSLTSAQEYMNSGAAEELKVEVDKMLGEQTDRQVFHDSSEAVRADIESQLLATGRHTPDVAAVKATFTSSVLSTLAARIGIMPEEFYQQFKLNIAAEGTVGQDQFDQAGNLVTDTPEFKGWFGGSQVVDDQGKPLVVYHGTTSDIAEFDQSASGKVDPGWLGLGSYFTSNVETANSYTRIRPIGNAGENVMPVYLSLKNPLRIEADLDYTKSQAMAKALGVEVPGMAMNARTEEQAKFLRDAAIAQGYDGVAYHYTHGKGEVEYVAFSPTQIKSAIGNRGTFDPNDANILHQDAIEAGQYGPIVHAWTSIARRDNAFRSPITKATDLSKAIDEVYRGEMPHELTRIEDMEVPKEGRTAPGFEIRVEAKDGSKVVAMKVFDADSARPFIEIGHEALGLGENLGRMYQALAGWALATGKTIRPDPRGLSTINEFRRTEQMISSMLKYGESKMWEPDSSQFIGLLSDQDYKAWLEYGRESPRLMGELARLKSFYWGPVESPASAGYDLTAARINNMALASARLAKRRVPGAFDNAIIDSTGNMRVAGPDGKVHIVTEHTNDPQAEVWSGPLTASGIGHTARARALITLQASGDVAQVAGALEGRAAVVPESLQNIHADGSVDLHPRAGARYPGLDRLVEGQRPGLDNLLLQSGRVEEGANAVTGDLSRVNADVRDAVESRLAKMSAEESARVRANLEEHKGTAWAAATVKGMAYREMLERAMAGQDVSNLARNAIWGKTDFTTSKRLKAFQLYPKLGEAVITELIQSADFLASNAKAENDVSTSFVNCDPSKLCAATCYAANDTVYPNALAKAEFNEFVIERYPREVAKRIAAQYKPTHAGMAGLSLRLNEKGDLSDSQVALVNALNEEGIQMQIFSKRPEMIRKIMENDRMAGRPVDYNLLMLSIDSTNLALAEQNPDLQFAVVIDDGMTEEMLAPIHPKVAVYFPINYKSNSPSEAQLRSRFPNLISSMIKDSMCPVDSDKMGLKRGTSFVTITPDKATGRKPHNPDKVWTCTACDFMGSAGCFKGERKSNERKAAAIMLPTGMQKNLELIRLRKELQSNLDSLLKLGGIDGELHKQLSNALREEQREVRQTPDQEAAGSGPQGASQGTQGSGRGGSTPGSNAGGSIYEQVARGSFNPDTLTITLLKDADLSTFFHESGHFYLEVLANLAGRDDAPPQIRQDFQQLLNWFGVRDIQEWYSLDMEGKRPYHEQFARGFEAYLFEGKSPSIEINGLFQRFRAWMISIYKQITALKVDLTDEVRGVMDRLVATDEQIALAEKGRSMTALFATAEEAGMSVAEFEAYQALGVEATATAIDQLQSRGLRDMRWLHKARGRIIAQLQKESKAQRASVMMEVRGEVMSMPVYRAWTFLTAKLGDDDRLPPPESNKSDPKYLDNRRDSMFQAIAKLGGIRRDQLISEWGMDPSEKARTDTGFGGPRKVDRDDGRTLDEMGMALADEGYLARDENDRYDMREFEEKFFDGLAGTDHYSLNFDYDAAVARPGDQIANPLALEAGRLDLGALRDMGYSEEAIAVLKARRMTAANGLHPDLVASIPGVAMTSGDQLVKSLLAAELPKDEIEKRTDARMLERYGDLTSKEAIEQAADMAIHNDARARMVTTEANALAKAVGQKKILTEAARDYAEAMINRLRIRDILPGKYANAEAKAAKAAQAAREAGDIELAAAEKRNQLINVHATKAAHNARDAVDSGLRYLKRFNRESTRRGLTPDYLDQIDALLDRFDLRAQSLKAIDRKASLRKWLEAQHEAGFSPEIPEDLIDGLDRKPVKMMTVEEFRGLVDSVRQIEHLGRLKKKMLTARNKKEYEAIRDEIVAGIEKHARGRKADTRSPTTTLGQIKQRAKGFWASHIKAATWANIMDGGQDGGPMWEYFIRVANERGDMETSMRAKATQELTEIMAPLFKMGRMGGAGIYIQEIDRSMNREARLAVALNTGNEGNLQRLMGGEGWTPAQLHAVLETITPDEWRVAQQIWDYFESYRPLIAEKEMRVYGKEPNWVQAGSMVIAAVNRQYGLNLRGGYFPIKYDPVASKKAEQHDAAESAKRQLQGAYTTATTRRSFTKTRAEEVTGRPLLYTLAGLYNGINDVIHDLAWHEWLIDTNRLLNSNHIDEAIRNHYGPEVVRQFKSWVDDVAEGGRATNFAGEEALSRLRQGVSIAGLGFNVMSAAIQPLGFTQSIVRIGPEYAARGLAKYLAHPARMTKQVVGMSSFMENRARTRFRELNELRNQVQGESTAMEMTSRYAFWLMMRFQSMVDIPTWWGAYEKAIAQGNEEIRARELADQAVIDSQGSGQIKDLSGIERSPAMKLFTVFYSFMNTGLQLGVSKTMTADTPAKRARLAADYLLLYTLPAVLGYALKQALTPGDSGDDDPEKVIKKLLASQIDYLAGLMVIVREFADVGKTLVGANDLGRDYTGPAGLRVITDAGSAAKQITQGEFDTALRKALVNVSGSVFGLPSAQVNRTWTGIEALAEGKTENPAAIAFGFQEAR